LSVFFRTDHRDTSSTFAGSIVFALHVSQRSEYPPQDVQSALQPSLNTEIVPHCINSRAAIQTTEAGLRHEAVPLAFHTAVFHYLRVQTASGSQLPAPRLSSSLRTV